MPSGAEQRIRAKKKQDLRDKQQRNRIIALLQQQKEEQQQMITPTTAAVPADFSPTATGGFTPPPGFTIPAGATALTGEAMQREGYTGAPTGPYGTPADWYKQPARVQPARSGLQGTGAPAWWQTLINPANRATGGGVPGWLKSLSNSQMVQNGLLGLGVAAQTMPMFGGTLTPAITALMNQRYKNAPASTTGTKTGRAMALGTTGARIPAPTQPATTSYGGGYSRYRTRRRGGGGGSKPPQQNQQGGYAADENTPAWYRALANWTIG